MQIILRIYDYLTAHKGLRRWVLASITLLALVSVCGLSYKEDITDFLPASTMSVRCSRYIGMCRGPTVL